MIIIIITSTLTIPLIPIIFLALLIYFENYITTAITTIVIAALVYNALRLIIGGIAYRITGNDNCIMDPKWPGVVSLIWISFALVGYTLELMGLL